MAPEPTRDVFRQDLPDDRALTGDDLQRLRFGVTLRGYAMSQVDDVLDRLGREVADRDRRIAELEATVAEHGGCVVPPRAWTDTPAGTLPEADPARAGEADR